MDTHEERKRLLHSVSSLPVLLVRTVSESMIGSVDLVNSVSNEQSVCAYRGGVEICAVCARARSPLVSSAAFTLAPFHMKQDEASACSE